MINTNYQLRARAVPEKLLNIGLNDSTVKRYIDYYISSDMTMHEMLVLLVEHLAAEKKVYLKQALGVIATQKPSLVIGAFKAGEAAYVDSEGDLRAAIDAACTVAYADGRKDEAEAVQVEPVAQHPDDIAVDQFAKAMKAKMTAVRAKGRSGWDDQERCRSDQLARMLIEHIDKGDPVDVANFAMMIHQRDALGIENMHIANNFQGISVLRFAAIEKRTQKAVQVEPVAWTEAHIDEYLEDYEMRGEDESGREGCYTPNENDKALIKDAMMGFTSFVPFATPQEAAQTVKQLSYANNCLVAALDRINDVLNGVYVDDVAGIVNRALAENTPPL